MKQEWRCRRCGKLLGVVSEDLLYFRSTRGQEYVASLPAKAKCRSCHSANELRPSRPRALVVASPTL